MSSFHGTLTVLNAGQVAQRLRDMLTGNFFTSVTVTQPRNFRPEVHIQQQLEGGNDGQHVTCNNDGKSVSITINDTNGLWYISTSAIKQGCETGPDPYFKFTDDYQGNQVTFVYHFCGDLYYRTIVVEGPIPPEGAYEELTGLEGSVQTMWGKTFKVR